MKFTGQFVYPELESHYKERLKDFLDKKLKEIAKIWIAAVTGRVPVWSGMSQGSLLKLVELVGGTLLITPVPGVDSRIFEGRALGQAIQRDFNITIILDVPHYNVQEYKDVGISKSAPWKSLAAGQAAVEPIIKAVRLPAPKLITKTIKI